MATYLGYIKESGDAPNPFINYTPIAALDGEVLTAITPRDLGYLLPDSEKGEINFSYNFNQLAHSDFVRNNFSHMQLILFSFDLDDLEDNYNRLGERNRTGYKVPAPEFYEEGKIKQIESGEIYQIIPKESVHSDFFQENIIEIDAVGLKSGMKVLLEIADDFFAGPYHVGYRELDHAFYVRPENREKKYVVSGYGCEHCYKHALSTVDPRWGEPSHIWHVAVLRQQAVATHIDIIRDHQLLESFRDSIQGHTISDGLTSLSNIGDALDQYNNSILLSSKIPEDIRQHRLGKLREMLTSEAELDNTLRDIANDLSGLIIKYRDEPSVSDLVNSVFESNPDLLERFQGIRIVQDRVNKLEAELQDLSAQKELTEETLNKSKAETELLKQEVLEQRTQELIKADEELAQRKNELDALLASLEAANDLQRLSTEINTLEKQVEFLQTHSRNLGSSNSNLETQFLERINKYHDQMVSISFDGYMSSKMLEAAAKWERGNKDTEYATLARELDNAPIQHKTPEDLINYLCEIVQTVRPQYKRNAIINIALCISQGFLTVFSGEPGGGKTSICNIMAQVLGLNKMADKLALGPDITSNPSRYIPISVERGWTSKRDLVGYYNPLSKAFDKSNGQLYDSLRILDMEKRLRISRYPFIILLDEANLSPMEYYWADFMNICDDIDSNGTINLGDNLSLQIPNTLRFVATINNDHTTETLSPRLIDRSWIITLPQVFSTTSAKSVPLEKIEVVSWDSLSVAFHPNHNVFKPMPPELLRVYESSLLTHLRKERFYVSPRVDIAIRQYCSVASNRFEDERYDDGTVVSAASVALDYAVAQKILPKISGSGESFSEWLEDLRNICSSHNLNNSAGILRRMIDTGNKQMRYYQFF